MRKGIELKLWDNAAPPGRDKLRLKAVMEPKVYNSVLICSLLTEGGYY